MSTDPAASEDSRPCLVAHLDHLLKELGCIVVDLVLPQHHVVRVVDVVAPSQADFTASASVVGWSRSNSTWHSARKPS